MILESLIISNLNQIIPQFDERTDKKIIDIVQSDFLNYLRVVKKLDAALDARRYFIEELAGLGIEVREEMAAFISLWYCCWKHRVKLVFVDEEFNRNAFQVQHVMRSGSAKLDKADFESLREPIIEYLILHGEYACTNLISDQLLRQTLGHYSKSVMSVEDKCNFISVALNRVKNTLLLSGPLVFMKVNKIYEVD